MSSGAADERPDAPLERRGPMRVSRRDLARAAAGLLLAGTAPAMAQPAWTRLPPTPALPTPSSGGRLNVGDVGLYHAVFGDGEPVLLLHGGMGHSNYWGHQVEALARRHRVIVLDARGHGRSTLSPQRMSYRLLADDVVRALDALKIRRTAIVGWSDGACVALILARQAPARVAGVFFFGCNMDPSGTKAFVPMPVIDRCFARHAKDYAALSETPDQFEPFVAAVSEMMRTQPNYTARDLAAITVPVAIVHAEHDEFIKREHADHLARSIPDAELMLLPGVSHFAPLQRPALFNAAARAFLDKVV